MQGPAWVSLFRRLPVELHEFLILVLNSGAEVVLNSIVRLEREFLVARGRMAGSMDAGRITIVPFDQIIYVAINKKITEPEGEALLTKPQPLPAGLQQAGDEDLPVEEEVAVENLMPEPPPAPVAPAEDAEPAAANGTKAGDEPAVAKPGHVSKAVLLARLRARLGKDKDGAGKSSGR
jgi:hypothetical protein